jgi:hypothetical protein
MHETGKQLLSLMFKPGETVCVSPNKFGYHSVPLENALSDVVTLVPTPDSVAKRNEGRRSRGLPDLTWEECFEQCPTNNLTLVALNPIKGFREDRFATAYRSFLVEVDYGPIEEQLVYLKRIGIPYSALVFSGSKSVHCLITLDTDIPTYEDYYLLAEWILNVATMADQNTKNPSRSIRIPGAEREPGKFQSMIEFKGLVKINDLANWLRMHPDSKPKPPEKRVASSEPIDFRRFKPWVGYALDKGLDPTKSRNKQWFAIACEFALCGYSEDDTINKLLLYFTPDRDFREKEWITTIKSAFKYVDKK